MSGIDKAVGGASSLIGSLFEENPYTGMMNEYGKMQGYISPYTDAGKQGLSGLQSLLSGPLASLISDPTGLEDKIMGSYQQSPYAKEQTSQLQDAMNNQAAASGNLGTPQAQRALAQGLQGIVSADQQNYLRNAMQPFEMGLQQQQQGYGQQIGAGEFGTNMQNEFLQNMSNLIGGKAQWSNKMAESRAGDVGSIASGIADMYTPGGWL